MTKELRKIIDESIKLERNVAALYTMFSKTFSEDSEFWKELALEENNHAFLIEEGRKSFLLRGEFPNELLAPKVEMVVEMNDKLASLLQEYTKNPPSRETAFNVALELENSAGEVHFQQAVKGHPTSETMAIFQHLNREDIDHARRILTYAQYKGLKIPSPTTAEPQT